MAEGHPFTQHPDTDAETFVQWKGTTVCMDLRCPCGAHGHIDADFTYYVQCPKCERVYELGTAVSAKVVEKPDARWHDPKMLYVDEED